jgi:hypothetical protein
VTLAGHGLVAPPPEVARQVLRKSSRATPSPFRGASHDP